jgi:DNA-binding NarL/FixJ family response regulator
VASRVSSRRFVGREPQLSQLRRLLDEAGAGHASVALVGGESGVGKTRLVDELSALARAQGARVLAGESVELAEGELPYAPIIGALRPLVRSQDPALDGVRAELARPRGDGGAPPQGRFFELLLDALDDLAQDAPLVLVLEDIHWADRSTRDFLAFAARNLGAERVLLVATYRTDELHRRHPLRRLLPEMERMDRTERVLLERLTREELADLLEDILGAPAEAATVDRLYARCEGNPLFAEELLAAGPHSPDLPPTLRDALMVRIETLDEPTQELLRVVAAAARADEALLEEVSGLAPAQVRPALREGLTHHVLVHGDDGRIAFRHALLREAIHDDLLPGEAVELHLKLARALERRVADGAEEDLDAVTSIAHHFAMAGEQPEALGAAVRAAVAAQRISAPAEATAQLERALALWPRVADAEQRAGQDHARLLERLAVAADALGDNDRARHAADRALDEVDARQDPRRAARLLEQRGRSLWLLGRGEETLASLDRGLGLLADHSGALPERAMLLDTKAKTLMLWGRFSESAQLCEQALQQARAVGLRSPEINTLNTLGVVLAAQGDTEGGIASLVQSIAMARADGRAIAVERGRANLADVLHEAGRVREAVAVVRDGLDEGSRLGRRAPWNALQLGELLVAVGEWDEASEIVAPEQAPRHVGVLAIFFHLIAGELWLARGHTELALELLTQARDLSTRALDPQWHVPIASLTAEALGRQQRFEDARAVLADAHARLLGITGLQDHGRVARLITAEIAIEADIAQRARDLGDTDGEATARDAAHDALLRARGIAGTPGTGPWLATAEAEATRAAGEASPEVWAVAARMWMERERPYVSAVVRWREAEAHAQLGDRASAAQAASAAHEIATTVGSTWLAEEVEALARRARLRLGSEPDDGPADDGAAPSGEDDPAVALGLTPREQEVLALVAAGATNREVGERLFMAEKTASVHVSRILAKLDVRSRTEAAAVAHRLGLLGELAR